MCNHYNRILTESDRYYVDEEGYDNCLFCLIGERGNMTQQEIGKILKLSKVRISQIERLALLKLRLRGGRKNILTRQ